GSCWPAAGDRTTQCRPRDTRAPCSRRTPATRRRRRRGWSPGQGWCHAGPAGPPAPGPRPPPLPQLPCRRSSVPRELSDVGGLLAVPPRPGKCGARPAACARVSCMIVGVPREVKEEESRVALTPSGVGAFVADGHRVLVEDGGGAASSLPDRLYRAAGAALVD